MVWTCREVNIGQFTEFNTIQYLQDLRQMKQEQTKTNYCSFI